MKSKGLHIMWYVISDGIACVIAWVLFSILRIQLLENSNDNIVDILKYASQFCMPVINCRLTYLFEILHLWVFEYVSSGIHDPNLSHLIQR